ncbi:MAG: AsmA-like C-terminal domain-containing protein [Alphaproteobacteria bacterium]
MTLAPMVKLITHGFKVFFVALVLLAVALLLFFASGPKKLDWIKPMIERAMVSGSAPYRVTVGAVAMDWQTLARVGTLSLESVDMRGLDGQIMAHLPKVDVTLQVLPLAMGQIALSQITIVAPSLYMVREASGELRLGLEENRPVLAVTDLLGAWGGSDQSQKKSGIATSFRRFSIENAKLKITDLATSRTLISTPFSLRLGRDDDGIRASAVLPFAIEGSGKTKAIRMIDANAEWQRTSGKSQVDLRLTQVPMELFCLVTDCGQVTHVKGDVSGSVTLAFRDGFVLNSTSMELETGKTEIEAPEIFPEPLIIEKSQLIGSSEDGVKAWNIETINLLLADTTISGNLKALQQEAGWSLSLRGESENLDMNKLYRYWPLKLAPKAREWVTTSIFAGTARHATISVNLTPEDFGQPVFPDKFLRAEIEAENLMVQYLPGFPEVKNVTGNVVFTGQTMTADITGGTLLTATTIDKARVVIPDLLSDHVPTEVTLDFNATAPDVARILALEYFKFDDSLGLNADTIQGSIQGTLALAFDAFSDEGSGAINLDAVRYTLEAKLQAIAQQGLGRGLALSQLDGTLSLNPDYLQFDGTARLQDTNLSLALARKSTGPLRVTVNGVIDQSQFAGLGLPPVSQVVRGRAGVRAELEMHGDDFAVRSADIDLTRLALDVPQITWKKAAGVRGSLRVTNIPRHRFAPHAYQFTITADDLRAAGEIAAPDDQVTFLSIPNLQTNLNDFGLTYEDTGATQSLRITGNRLDTSANYASQENSLLADFPPLTMDVNLRELVLTQGSTFTGLRGTLSCDRRFCRTANFTGRVGDSSFLVRISSPQGQRRFDLNADNAGNFLRSLDISDRVFGGNLSLSGTYDDTQTPPLLNGRLLMEKFTVRNSRILERMLSVGSLQGIRNLLTGDGIRFDKLAADLMVQKGKISIKNGRTSGNSLGITFEGAVDTKSTVLGIRGVLVPAFWLNSFIGRIPVIGALAGGAGEGVVAFRYAVQGGYSDPKVTVNPLSGFTPGFLRNIFDAFDGPLPAELQNAPQ